MTLPTDRFSWRFDQALALASLAHDGALRKGTAVPYIMHPLHVARILDRHGFSEDVVVAGLLHDVLEDADFGNARLQVGLLQTFSEFADTLPSEAAFRSATEAFMAATFGNHVVELVRSVTEIKSDGLVKRPWRVRKDEQIAHIPEMNRDQAALKAADTLHNSQSILRDVQRDGLETLRRFKGSIDQTLWYYGAVADGLRDVLAGHPLHLELDAAVFELTEVVSRLLAADSPGPRCPFCGAVHESIDHCAQAAPGFQFAVENRNGQRIRSLAHWFRLAPPVGRERHWVNGRSAREVARVWSGLSSPNDVITLLRRTEGFHDFRPTTVIAELVTPLDEFGEGRNHDLVVLGEASGKRILIGIEAKSDEELGPRIGSYLEKTDQENNVRLAEGKTRLSQVPARIDKLKRLIFGDEAPDLSDMRYQLLHGLCGTLIEADNRKADVAVFLVHTFMSGLTQPQKVDSNEADVLEFTETLQKGAADKLRTGCLIGPLHAGGDTGTADGRPYFVGLLRTQLHIGGIDQIVHASSLQVEPKPR